jgi:hypothetical protein
MYLWFWYIIYRQGFLPRSDEEFSDDDEIFSSDEEDGPTKYHQELCNRGDIAQ